MGSCLQGLGTVCVYRDPLDNRSYVTSQIHPHGYVTPLKQPSAAAG